MKDTEVEYFKKLRFIYNEKIETYKLAKISKIGKNRIVDFLYSFFGNFY